MQLYIANKNGQHGPRLGALSTDCMAYANTLLDLPAMQDWYNSALQEPWIEPAHDAEVWVG
jgi:hypothetical protein